MQRRPFRYELPINDNAHPLPAGKILHISKGRRLSIDLTRSVEVWVEVTVDGPNTQKVKIIGTGHPIPDGAEHLATCLDESLVWHLYRLKEGQ